MCPGCAAMAAIVVGGVVSTGGLTALAVKVLRKNKSEKSDSKEKE
ncbi:MAG TPA: hypothetical protein VMP68_03265 [Candidatus Eisenbacteria bacterium]|nr:hypothetical protein [Candidatus Eisenbacteria bacterium]